MPLKLHSSISWGPPSSHSCSNPCVSNKPCASYDTKRATDTHGLPNRCTLLNQGLPGGLKGAHRSLLRARRGPALHSLLVEVPSYMHLCRTARFSLHPTLCAALAGSVTVTECACCQSAPCTTPRSLPHAAACASDCTITRLLYRLWATTGAHRLPPHTCNTPASPAPSTDMAVQPRSV